MARKELCWEKHLAEVLSTKPAEVVQEAIQVLKKHGYPVKKELKSGLYYSTDAKFFFEQNTTVNDKSTAGRFDPKVFIINSCVLLKKEFGISGSTQL